MRPCWSSSNRCHQPDRTPTFVLLIVAVVVLYRPIINIVVPAAINATKATTPSSELRQQVLDTVEKVGAALTANVTSVYQALDALLSGGLLRLGIVTLAVTLSVYVVLRPFVPAFRLSACCSTWRQNPRGATARLLRGGVSRRRQASTSLNVDCLKNLAAGRQRSFHSISSSWR